MNNLLGAIDKYKFGLIAALTAYVLIFMYLQMNSYQAVIHYEPFDDGARVEIPEDEIELLPENILVPQDFNGEVKNISRDANDDREKSNKNWSENKSVADVEAEYKKLEQQMYADAGGSKTRDEIRREMESRKEKDLEKVKNQNTNSTPTNGGDKVYSGNVMVDWSLTSRNPHQNNNWYVRNPGYTCGYASSGVVTVIIKVNQNGDVVTATYDAGQSRGANPCMIEQAIKYAKLSRFNYSAGAESSQTGRITYTFISQ